MADDLRLFLDREITFGDVRFGYHARSGPGAWDEFVDKLRQMEADRFFVVTERGIPVSLAKQLVARVSAVAPCTMLSFPAGETGKRMLAVEHLAEGALKREATRRSCVIVLGGGVAGNVGGLLAASLYRGIRLVHVPTTLLAMTDSVLSLKQTVNSRLGKGHLGTFHAPEFVWADLGMLETLPVTEIKSALCEAVKNVLTVCPDRYDAIAELLKPDGRYTQGELLRFIDFSIEAKSSLMRNDPYERHDAVVFEYGHTIGHALEKLSGGALRHGFAIGVGMMAAARISRELGWLSGSEERLHGQLLARNGAPLVAPGLVSTDEVMAAIRHDNKRGYLFPVAGRCDLVLLDALGKPHRTRDTVMTQIDEELVLAGLRAIGCLPPEASAIRAFPRHRAPLSQHATSTTTTPATTVTAAPARVAGPPVSV